MTGHDHPRPESISAAVDEQMLEDFLNQHLLGSRSGVKAFRAAEQTWAGTSQEAALRRLSAPAVAAPAEVAAGSAATSIADVIRGVRRLREEVGAGAH